MERSPPTPLPPQMHSLPHIHTPSRILLNLSGCFYECEDKLFTWLSSRRWTCTDLHHHTLSVVYNTVPSWCAFSPSFTKDIYIRWNIVGCRVFPAGVLKVLLLWALLFPRRSWLSFFALLCKICLFPSCVLLRFSLFDCFWVIWEWCNSVWFFPCCLCFGLIKLLRSVGF